MTRIARAVAEFGTQPAHVHVDAAILDAVGLGSDDRVDEERTRQNPPARMDQGMKQVELGSGQLERLIIQFGQATGWVHDDVAVANRGRLRRARPPEHRAHSRHQLGRRKRLGQVVIGA